MFTLHFNDTYIIIFKYLHTMVRIDSCVMRHTIKLLVVTEFFSSYLIQ